MDALEKEKELLLGKEMFEELVPIRDKRILLEREMEHIKADVELRKIISVQSIEPVSYKLFQSGKLVRFLQRIYHL